MKLDLLINAPFLCGETHENYGSIVLYKCIQNNRPVYGSNFYSKKMGNDDVRFVILSPLFLTSDGMLDYIIGRSKRLTKSIFGITIKDL
jgi:hypothetical protein